MEQDRGDMLVCAPVDLDLGGVQSNTYRFIIPFLNVQKIGCVHAYHIDVCGCKPLLLLLTTKQLPPSHNAEPGAHCAKIKAYRRPTTQIYFNINDQDVPSLISITCEFTTIKD